MITIIHWTNIAALTAEIKEKAPECEFILDTSISSVQKDGETLKRVSVSEEEHEIIKSLINVKCLGDYDDLKSNPENEIIYNRIWEPGKIINKETGQTKPIEFSRFLGEQLNEQ
jgi:hypothetical protein